MMGAPRKPDPADQNRPSSRVGLAIALAVGGAACIAASGAAAAQHRVRTTFTGSSAVLANPERGFYSVGRTDLAALDPAFLERAFRDGYRLIYARIDLEPYRSAPIPADHLARLDAGFAAARRAGVKLIVRPVYNYPRGETQYREAKDAPLDLVLRHIAQLRPLLHANSDVIAFVQAGFVGAWGEWHTSSNRLTEPAARNAIKDALLAAVPDHLSVQFRYPPYIREWATGAPAGRARIGFHNDCFLASATDVGTYRDEVKARAAEQDAMDRLGDAAPFGGETCNPADEPTPSPRNGCADILAEGARYNLTYLNAHYYRRLFHDRWIADGCFDDVARKLGYRLRLLDASHRSRIAPGEPLGLSLSIRNEGWARPFNPRKVVLLMRGRTTGAERRLDAPGADPRSWVPGADHRVALDITLPGDLAPDVYDLLLALPDASPRLSGDPRYAVRPANADDRPRGQGWDDALGAFRLGTAVRVEHRRPSPRRR